MQITFLLQANLGNKHDAKNNLSYSSSSVFAMTLYIEIKRIWSSTTTTNIEEVPLK